jgi:two-component system response regulator PilR (NtrC family)
MEKHRILIVDDEPDILELLDITLSRMGHRVFAAEDYATAIGLLERQSFDFCLTDMKLPDGDGIDLVRHIQHNRPELPVAVITAHGNMELAIRAMKAGAYDFVSKPVSLEKLRQLVEQGIQTGTTPSSATSEQYQLIGDSPQLTKLRETIGKFARSQAPVFIEGQSGTGKELVARQVHLRSARSAAPFVAINCGAIPAELIESELFGHVKGSFSGAINDNPGLFRAAEGGTLFLDEVAELPLNLQVKLLRVLQEKAIRPVGSQTEQPVNVRIVSASHKNLGELVSTGKFRHDLYYRINVIAIHIPPLRERPQDILPISQHILNRLNRETGRQLVLHDDAIEALRVYDFPGNVRELENILERASAMTDDDHIDRDDLGLPTANTQSPSGPGLIQKTAEMEARELEKALVDNKWNQSAAARQLGITLRQLRYRCKKLDLTKSSDKNVKS